MDKQHQVLKQIFGYETFRAGQEGLVDSVLSGRDVLGVMPTGAGKSICYQVPALCFPGILFEPDKAGLLCTTIPVYTPNNTSRSEINPPSAATTLNTKQIFISLQPHSSQ